MLDGVSMLNSLLSTKLHFPSVRIHQVPRPRLVSRLQQGLAGPLTLISAPAGSGKTTLMAEWRDGPGRHMPAAWFSIDAADNDPVLFFQYLTTAIDAVRPGLAQKVMPLLQSSGPIPLENVLLVLINTLSQGEQDFIMVLDDYHFIENSAIYKAQTFLLDHLPPCMHLAILTRADPALPLARLRARGQLTEIRAEHLRFSVEEADQFLNEGMGLTLTGKQVAALEARTEGWIAGLKLAALSLERQEDIESFVSAFAGSYRYIADYLVEEVLNHQPEPVQLFLLKTSVLDRMNGALCTAVTGNVDAQAMLENLERSNLFLVSLGEEREWYRYHHLFADQLRARLIHLQSEQISTLQRRASEWCAQQGLTDEAINYALRAKDFDRAAQLIEQSVPPLAGKGRIETIARWIGNLPKAIIAGRPRLGLSLAWAWYFEYKFDQTEDCIRLIEQNLKPEEAVFYQGELALWHGIIARSNSDLDRSRDFLLQALRQLPVEFSSLRCRAWIFLGLVYLEYDVNKAQEAFIQAGDIVDAKDNQHGALAALYFLAWAQILQGQLVKAALTTRNALLIAEQVKDCPVACYAHLATAELLCELNDLENAAQHLAIVTELAQLGGNSDHLVGGALYGCRVERACGNWEKAQKLISRAEELARPTIPWSKMQLTDEQICLYLAQGKVNEAAEWIHAYPILPEVKTLIPGLYEQIIQARVHVARHEVHDILPQLDRLLEQVKNLGITRWVIQIHCLQALAYYALGNTHEALNQLESALSLAEPEGSIQVFLDEGGAILVLLHLAQKRIIAPGFVSGLIAAFARQGFIEISHPALPPDILSKREVELVGLIASGCSNKEIAQKLVISLGTVKRHTVNIFTKLNVKNRTEAVARARELGLL
jgi:LuxR family transcriptional regulator, maltose regulon positive regulatory protein